MRLSDRVVIVTGASSGIGYATARLLAGKGAEVWAVARSEERLRRLANAAGPEGERPVGRAGGRIIPFRGDVSVDGDRAALVEAAGPVDILVNNAGLGWIGPLREMGSADIRTLFEVNVLGLIDLTQRVLPGMLERRQGHVVNVASVAAYVAFPPLSLYAATKFAVLGYSDGLRRELAFTGVTAASVNPGPIATGFVSTAMGGGPGDGEATVGVGTGWVARAIARSIRLRHVPGYQTVAVPRLAGFVRLAAVPGLSRLTDVAAVVGRPTARLTGRG